MVWTVIENALTAPLPPPVIIAMPSWVSQIHFCDWLRSLVEIIRWSSVVSLLIYSDPKISPPKNRQRDRGAQMLKIAAFELLIQLRNRLVLRRSKWI